MSGKSSTTIRSALDHPVIDADGHWLELQPVFEDYVAEVAGPKLRDRYLQHPLRSYGNAWYSLTPEERQNHRARRPGWWLVPAETRDRAAAMLPALFRERMDDWGIDLALIYPTMGFTLSRFEDEEMRRALVRAYNVMARDMFQPYSDRILPAAVVTLNTPAEAIEETEYAVRTLGMRMAMMNCTIPRRIAADEEWQSDPKKQRVYIDCLAMDSPYDYDPVWAKCVELNVAVTNHTGSMGWPDRSSPTSFVADHLGHFAQSHHYFARGLFLGGVTQRFPGLNFGFLEGGIGWACNLYSDLIGHWQKRNKQYMNQHLNPTNLDRGALRQLFKTYAKNDSLRTHVDAIMECNLDCVEPGISLEELSARDLGYDEFAAVDISGTDDFARLFGRPFYFGCEADDPMTAVAFDKRMKLPLKPILGSDISHFDVPDASEVLEEAWELVDDGLIDEQDFREFTFSNAVQLHGAMNPDFFKGTVVEHAAAHELENGSADAGPVRRTPQSTETIQ